MSSTPFHKFLHISTAIVPTNCDIPGLAGLLPDNALPLAAGPRVGTHGGAARGVAGLDAAAHNSGSFRQDEGVAAEIVGGRLPATHVTRDT